VNDTSAIVACEFCSLVWAIVRWGGLAYIVFWLDHSAWWLLLGLMGWDCKYLTLGKGPEHG
jgi:hypothetical protein